MPNQLMLMLSRIRYREALIFQAPTLLGLALFLPSVSFYLALNAVVAWMGSFFVAAFTLAINDWADISLDTQNTLKRKDTFLGMGIHPRQMLTLAFLLALGGIGLFTVLSTLHVFMALLAIMFSLAYSVPVWGIRGKSVPVFSSFLHFGGTLLSFLLGSLTFVSADLRSLLLASYPAVLITAGHLVQEVEDYEEDRLSRCQTNAVRFGQKPVFFLATTLFTFSFVILYWLADIGLLPSVIKYFSILYLGYAVIAAQAYRAGLTQNSVRHLRDQYRILFGIVVLAMLTISLLNKRGL
jgi:4-hydroxybenzoate polyprenyltransferase